MTDEEVKLVLGGLLHDIGKVIYRQGDDRRKHSKSGYDFLRQEVGIEEKEILDAVLYHHADMLKQAGPGVSETAYIVYIADNIASAADRRQNDAEDRGFEIAAPLESVFNILNGNRQKYFYEPKTLDIKDDINYPTEIRTDFNESFYSRIKENIWNSLKGVKWDQEYINSLLEVLEANLAYVPSSTAKHEKADISLYDHMKLTAAAAGCIYAYMRENNISDYREALFTKAKEFYAKDVFLLYSMDVSGIQDFIYTIASKNALKTLRARSFYLEIMMEHIIDSLLEKLHLSRANLIYSGGGHCYMLLANTESVRAAVEQYRTQLNGWLMEKFDIDLFVADGYAPCSANTLQNMPQGSYAQIFRTVSNRISEQKGCRYRAEDIISFNAKKQRDYTRECKVCKRMGQTDDEDVCPLCRAMEHFSRNILYDEFFTVSLRESDGALPLPGNYYLTADDAETLREKMKSDDYFVRAYSKNKMFTGRHLATKLWVGNYTSGKSFKQMAQEAEGIERIGVLRADVDNLGQAFVAGFEDQENNNRYVTLSRTATLSRQLSLFFKLHINRILKKPQYSLWGEKPKERNATVCYSGGDDLFIVGAWNEVIELAVEIRRDFERYTQGTLTLSAGIGIYHPSYPISAIAQEVAVMEDASKKLPGKNAVTVFEDGDDHKILDECGKELSVSDGSYHWKEFEEKVIEEKLKVIYRFLSLSDDRGKNFLYHLMELICGMDDKINFARFVYLLARLEPDEKAADVQKENYKEFSGKMYEWVKDGSQRRQLKTAINYYAYLTREREEYK